MPRITKKAKEVIKHNAQINGTFDDLRDLKYESRQSLREAKSRMRAEDFEEHRYRIEWVPGGREAARKTRMRKRKTSFKATGEGKLARVKKPHFSCDGDLCKGDMVMIISEGYNRPAAGLSDKIRDWVVDVMANGSIIKEVPSIFLEEIDA